ncbi:hypothetical protein RSAG8_01735, partial [Rhizoctonia solani AG-8 WAC10335]
MNQDTTGGPLLTIRDVKKLSVNFVLEGVELAFANSVRRVCLAHRLGMVPLLSTNCEEA